MVGLGCLEGALMIDETLIMMLLALNFGFGAYILMKIDSKNADLSRLKSDFEKSLRDMTFPALDLESLKEDLMDMVEGLMSSMRVPTALDHGMGLIAQMIQMKSMRQAQELGLMNAPDQSENTDD
jgi:hypothetical protein